MADSPSSIRRTAPDRRRIARVGMTWSARPRQPRPEHTQASVRLRLTRRTRSSSRLAAFLVFALAAASIPSALAQSITIYDIQSDTYDGDASNYDYQVVDCSGGILVGKFRGSRPRIILQDPNHPHAWGAIQVKDWTAGDLIDHVEPGDWVELTNVFVEEYRGGTFLQWQTTHNPGFKVVSSGNPLPPPILVPVTHIPAPIEYLSDDWRVENHDAEPYESMRLIVRDVTVTRKNLGKAVDNYNLRTPDGNDCWAADYMNQDKEPSGYHRFVTVGQHFCAVAGVFEQYSNALNGWDYYQLITMKGTDLAICGDGDNDGDVELDDWPRFDECFSGPLCDNASGGCDPPVWTRPASGLPIQRCLMMDMDYDGDVDLRDFATLQKIVVVP